MTDKPQPTKFSPIRTVSSPYPQSTVNSCIDAIDSDIMEADHSRFVCSNCPPPHVRSVPFYGSRQGIVCATCGRKLLDDEPVREIEGCDWRSDNDR